MYKEEFDIDTISLKKGQCMGLVKPLYKIFYPDMGNDFSTQWQSCLQQILEKVKQNTLYPFRISIFVRSENQNDFLNQQSQIQQSIKRFFGKKHPPFGVIMQSPQAPNKVTCEVGFINATDAIVKYELFNNHSYCVIEAENYTEYWTVGTNSVNSNLNTLSSSQNTFDELVELYQSIGISFNNIVRQWNYVGEILSRENEDGRFRQHYQMFNEARSCYYGKFRTRTDFPAATGIGMLHRGICIDSFAINGNNDLKIIPISNPGQSESYKYEQSVLVGDPDKKMQQNQPPQFERAKLISLHDSSRIVISGTASIIGQDTIGIDDVEEQTRITIQNINRLFSEENLRNHYPEITAIPDKYSYVRVYVKHPEDFEKVKVICAESFGNVPINYVVADICRDNLLVEIEAELISDSK